MNNGSPPSAPLVTGLPPKRGVRGGRVGFTAECRGNDQAQLQGQKRFPHREFGCWAATLKVRYFLPSSPEFLSVQSSSFLSPPRSLAARELKWCCALSQESLDAAAVGQEKTAYVHRNMARKLDSKHCALWQRGTQVQPHLLPATFLQSKARWSRKNSSHRHHTI